jgi:hypothetical protein
MSRILLLVLALTLHLVSPAVAVTFVDNPTFVLPPEVPYSFLQGLVSTLQSSPVTRFRIRLLGLLLGWGLAFLAARRRR